MALAGLPADLSNEANAQEDASA